MYNGRTAGAKRRVHRYPPNGDAMVFARFAQAVAVALADGADFPLLVAAVDLRENERGVVAAGHRSKRELQRCLAAVFAGDGGQHFAEAAKFAVRRVVVDAGGDVQRLYRGRDGSEVDGDVVVAADFAVRANEVDAVVGLEWNCGACGQCRRSCRRRAASGLFWPGTRMHGVAMDGLFASMMVTATLLCAAVSSAACSASSACSAA